MICGLLLLPPSSAHAESGMHGDTQAVHPADHHAAHGQAMVLERAAGDSLHVSQTDLPAESFEGEPCCGGICLTAALHAQSDLIVSGAQTALFLLFHEAFISADTRGHLRPPRA